PAVANNSCRHRMIEFSQGNILSSELPIYTWMDATLKELSLMLKDLAIELRRLAAPGLAERGLSVLEIKRMEYENIDI
ncbi:hypothetical protein P7K49_031526, partial [Saguinus oedipus]